MIDAQIDYLVLGCTHYPYLIPLLIDLLPKRVKIIDSGAAVAKQTRAILLQNELLNSKPSRPKIKFYSNSEPSVLSSLLEDEYSVEYLDF